MSAIVMIRGTDGVVMAGDGVGYNDAGEVISLRTKITPLLHLDCIMGVVGAGDMQLQIQHRIGEKYTDFDELLAGIADDLRWVTEVAMRFHPVIGWPVRSTIALAGWSKTREQYELHKISNWDKIVEGMPDAPEPFSHPAYRLLKIDGFWGNAFPPPEFVDQYKLNDWDDLARNASAFAGRWICGCRQNSGFSETIDGPWGCGGFVQIATFSLGSFNTCISHRWPDELGVPVDPSKGEMVPANLMPQPTHDEERQMA